MTNEQKVGLFFFVGVALFFAAVEATVGVHVFSGGYHLWSEFGDVQGLTKGDKVRVGGVKMGSVDAIDIAGGVVRVKLRLDDDAVVRRDSVAKLDFEALSGNRFIAISLGSPQQARLRDGESVEGEAVPGISDMVAEMQRVGHTVVDLAESLNRNQETVLTNVNSLVEENRRSLSAALENMASITQKLDSGEGTAARLLNDGELYDRLTKVAGNLQAVSDRLARGEGTIGRLLSDDDLYQQVRETVATLNDTVRNLEEVTASVRRGEGTLGRLVTDDSLYQDAQSAVHSLDRATTSIEDESPIVILGTFVSTLF